MRSAVGSLQAGYSKAASGGMTVKTITVDKTLCGSGDTTDFPLLFSGTYTWAKSVGNGGLVNLTTGLPYDCVIYADSGCTTKLDFERVRHDISTGAVEYWVRVPTLTHSTNLVFYIRVGNVAISTEQANPTGVWDAHEALRLHLPDGTTLSAVDSTGNANTASIVTATAAAGLIGGAAVLDGTTGKILRFPHSASVNISGAVTLSAWVYLNAYRTGGTYIRGIIGKGNSNGSTGYYLRIGADGSSGTKGHLAFGGSAGIAYGSDLPLSGRHHVVATCDGVGGGVIYLDGSAVATGTVAITDISTDDLGIGEDYYPDQGSDPRLWDGLIDEVGIADIARSADWVLASFNNQQAPSSFYAVT